jgi:hypothetical protein
MKTTMKIFLSICIFATVALADGDMGTGGKKPCPTAAPCLVNVQPAGDEELKKESGKQESDNAIVIWLNEILKELLG